MLLQDVPTKPVYVDWTLIAALLANLIALAALFKDWFIQKLKRGSIDFYETGSLSVYYGTAGPVLEVLGNMLAIHEDQFVRTMKITIQNEQTSSRHQFDWRYSRISTMGPEGETTSFVFASGFMAIPSQPWYIDAVFHDAVAAERLIQYQDEVWRHWQAFLADGPSSSHGTPTIPAAPGLSPIEGYAGQSHADIETPVASYFRDFLELSAVRQIKSEVERICYWDAGNYSLTLDIITARPERHFRHRCTFSLPLGDARSLIANAEMVLRVWCRVPLPIGSDYTSRVDYTCDPLPTNLSPAPSAVANQSDRASPSAPR